jgi:hypothetical protein
MAVSPADARSLWRVLEPIHAVTYFAPEVRDALRATGLRGFWMGYTAARLAPLGAVGPEVGTAVLHNFAPSMVARSLPDAWSYASPETVLEARSTGLRVALAPFLDRLEPATTDVVVARLRRSLEVTPVDGRPLFGAYAALPWPDDPQLALWHAATLVREHRGDGHIAALTAADISGVEAHVLATAVRDGDPDLLRDDRGWTEDAWADAGRRLASRDLLDSTGAATPLGHELHDAIESATDLAARRALTELDPGTAAETATALAGVAQRIAATGLVPFPNPIGLPRP